MLITVAAIFIYLKFSKVNFKIPLNDLLKLIGVGSIIALHWFCFYHAINVSNISVTLVAFATGTLFISVIEPLFFKRKIILYEIVFGILILAAISIIFNIETRYALGILLGVLSALTAAFFTVFNGLLVKRITPQLISFYELAGGFLALTLFLLFNGTFQKEFFIVSPVGWFWLSVLAIVGTAYPFIVSINLMKSISPFTITLTVNLETVYGIILAYIFWQKEEAMTPGFYIGTLIILLAVFGNGVLKKYLVK